MRFSASIDCIQSYRFRNTIRSYWPPLSAETHRSVPIRIKCQLSLVVSSHPHSGWEERRSSRMKVDGLATVTTNHQHRHDLLLLLAAPRVLLVIFWPQVTAQPAGPCITTRRCPCFKAETSAMSTGWRPVTEQSQQTRLTSDLQQLC